MFLLMPAFLRRFDYEVIHILTELSFVWSIIIFVPIFFSLLDERLSLPVDQVALFLM